jgi:hypothetical protein
MHERNIADLPFREGLTFRKRKNADLLERESAHMNLLGELTFRKKENCSPE